MTGNVVGTSRPPTFPGVGSVVFVVLLIVVIATITAAIAGTVPPPPTISCGIEDHRLAFD